MWNFGVDELYTSHLKMTIYVLLQISHNSSLNGIISIKLYWIKFNVWAVIISFKISIEFWSYLFSSVYLINKHQI